MSRTTQSAILVARTALEMGRRVYEAYPHPNAPKKFTQPQWFAMLALRQFFGTGYEATCVRLGEWREFRQALELRHVPSASGLHEAEGRLLKKDAEKMLDATDGEARDRGLIQTMRR